MLQKFRANGDIQKDLHVAPFYLKVDLAGAF